MTIFLPARATGALLRRLAGLRQLMLLTLLLAAAPAAFSATLQCGRYDSTDGHGHWQVESADRAVRQIGGLAATPLLIGQQGQTLEVADLLDGYSNQYTLSGDGRRISNRFSAFTLSTPARCQASAPAAAGSCRADIAHCFAQAGSASPAQLQQWCREDLPFACNQLLQHYQQAARAAHHPAVDDPDLIEPAVCREHTPAYDETACNEAAGAAISKAMGRMLLGALDRSRPRLPEDQLHELMQLCRGPAHAAFCANVAEAHWDAGQYLLARQALQLACSRGGGQRTCAQAEALSALVAADLQAAPATALPCGDYRAASGLIDTLSFADQGLVAMSMGTRLRARLQDGRVHIRHDKGDDFVFQVLDRQRLIGIDSWNRYALYQREGGSERCSAAPVYVEVPLLQDCPSGAGRPGAQACCDAGAMQGCNVLGHQQALNGDWQAAAPYYLKMCRAGIRVGCENLVSAYANGGDDHIREQIAGLCAGDASGSHVACDVLATSNWDMLALGVELSRTAERIEAAGGDAVAEPGAHRNRKSLKK